MNFTVKQPLALTMGVKKSSHSKMKLSSFLSPALCFCSIVMTLRVNNIWGKRGNAATQQHGKHFCD